jgi:ribosome-associated protein
LEPLRVRRDVVIPGSELGASYARSGGPGGQNVNRLETKVVLRWCPRRSVALSATQLARVEARLAPRLTTGGEIVVHASRHRERSRNLEDARGRLAGLVREALAVQRARKPTRPTRGAVERRLSEKRQRAGKKRERRGADE